MMENIDLKEKYRPTNFDDFIGNDQTVETLQNFIDKKGGLPPAILLTGPRGCGKTTLARILKVEMKVHDREFIEMNAADDRGIDAMRSIKKLTAYNPLGGTRIVFFDEAHRITPPAQDALLKSLEKPPIHTRFVLATTDPQMLLETVRSRCKILEVSLLPDDQMEKLVRSVVKKERLEFPDDVINEIVQQAEGSAREAIDLVDTAMTFTDQPSLIKALQRWSKNKASIKNLCQALLKAEQWKQVAEILKGLDEDAEKVRYAVLGYMNAVLLNSGNKRPAMIIGEFTESFMYSKKAGLTLACWMVTNSK